MAGDFNDWGEKLDAPMHRAGLRRAVPPNGRRAPATFPSLVPVFSLDRIYMRGMHCVGMQVPRGGAWIEKTWKQTRTLPGNGGALTIARA